jgi:hypothetical protein
MQIKTIKTKLGARHTLVARDCNILVLELSDAELADMVRPVVVPPVVVPPVVVPPVVVPPPVVPPLPKCIPCSFKLEELKNVKV